MIRMARLLGVQHDAEGDEWEVTLSATAPRWTCRCVPASGCRLKGVSMLCWRLIDIQPVNARRKALGGG